jgi:hypothetical protein
LPVPLTAPTVENIPPPLLATEKHSEKLVLSIFIIPPPEIEDNIPPPLV